MIRAARNGQTWCDPDSTGSRQRPHWPSVWPSIGLLLLALAEVFGCTQAPEASRPGDSTSPLSPRWIHRGDQCSPKEARAVELDQAETAGFSLPPGLPTAEAKGRTLAIGVGRFPTGGCSVALAEPPRRDGDGTLVVRVTATEPPADAATAQVLTYPCGVLDVRGAEEDPAATRVEYEDKVWRIGDEPGEGY